MQRDGENVEFSEAIWSCRFTLSVFSASSSLSLDYKLLTAEKRDSFLSTLHLYLNTYLTDGIFDKKVIRCVTYYLGDLPAFEFLQDIDEECSLSNDASNAAHSQVA